MPSVSPSLSPVHERRGNEIYSRGIVARGAPLSGWLSSCRGTTEGGGGYRGAWYPLPPSPSKSLYQPGNYTSFRAISSTLVEGIGGGGGGGLLLVSRWRAHHHLALVSFHCDSPSPAPLSQVGINCHSCLRRVINCRNLSCAGIIPRNFLVGGGRGRRRNIFTFLV